MTVWDVSTAIYTNKSFFVGSQDTAPYDLTFNSEGTMLYIMGRNTFYVYQYALSTAWDISTAIYTNKSFFVGDRDTLPYGISFKPDGTIMYILGSSNKKVFQYTLSIAWDVSTAGYAHKSFFVGDQDYLPYGISFKPDGTIMYITGTAYDKVHQYILSTAWNVAKASYSDKFFYLGDQSSRPVDVFFKPDGTMMYIMGNNTQYIYQYTLSIAWDVSTAIYTNKFFYLGNQDTEPFGLFFLSDGTTLYMVGYYNTTVYQYTLVGEPPPPPKKEASRTGVYSFKTLKL